MTSIFQSAITNLISRYVKDFKEHELKVSLWSGEVTVHNSDLNVEELRRVLPISLSKASLKYLRVAIPWTRLLTDSVTIVGSGLSLDISSSPRVIVHEKPSGPAPASTSDSFGESPEVAEIVRSVKHKVKLQLSDVNVVVQGKVGEEVQLHADEIATFPFTPPGMEELDESEENGEFARRLEVVGLKITLDGRIIVFPVAIDVIVSYYGSHLKYCNVTSSEDIKLSVSDLDIDILKRVLVSLFSPSKETDTVAVEPMTPEKVVVPESPATPMEDSSVKPQRSWSTSIWEYGKSWLSSSASPNAVGSPVTPPRKLSVKPMVSPSFTPSSPGEFAPSWFRVDIPLFSLEVSRYVEVVRDGALHLVKRPIFSSSFDGIVVEWSHSTTALELIARVGGFSANDLWDQRAEPRKLLAIESDHQTNVISVDFVSRPNDRFVEASVEPFCANLSGDLVREASIFLSSVLSKNSDAKEDVEHSNVEVEEVEEPMMFTVQLKGSCVKLFGSSNDNACAELTVERILVKREQVELEGVSIVGANRFAFVKIPKVLVLHKDRSIDVLGEGAAVLTFHPQHTHVLFGVLSEFSRSMSEEAPLYTKSECPSLESSQEENGEVRMRREIIWIPKTRSSSRKSSENDIQVQIHRLSVHLVVDDNVPVADILVDSVVVNSKGSFQKGSIKGLLVIDRSCQEKAGMILVSSVPFSVNDNDPIATRAYAKLVDTGFAPDVVFESPGYANVASDPVLVFEKVSGDYAVDSFVESETKLEVGKLFIRYDPVSFGLVGRALSSGLSDSVKEKLSKMDGSSLMWLYLCEKKRRLVSRNQRQQVLGISSHALLYNSLAEFLEERHDQDLKREDIWKDLTIYLQASGSNTSFKVAAITIFLPGNVHLTCSGVAGGSRLSETGFRYGAVSSHYECEDLCLLSEHGVEIVAPTHVSIDVHVPLNGVRKTLVSLKALNVSLASDMLGSLMDSWNTTSSAQASKAGSGKSETKVVAEALAISMDGLTMYCGGVTFSSSGDATEISLLPVHLTFAERTLASVASLHFKSSMARRKLNCSKVQVTYYKDEWLRSQKLVERVQKLVERVQKLFPSQKSPQQKTRFEFAVRESCISMPLGRNSALHVAFGSLKGSQNDYLLKKLALYFGPLQKWETVLGGSVRVDKAILKLEDKTGQVSINKMSAKLVLESDVQHLRYFLQEMQEGSSGGDAVSSTDSNKSFSVSSVSVAELSASVSSLNLVLKSVVAHPNSRSLEVPLIEMYCGGDYRVLRLRNISVHEMNLIRLDSIDASVVLTKMSDIEAALDVVTKLVQKIRRHQPVSQQQVKPRSKMDGRVPVFRIAVLPSLTKDAVEVAALLIRDIKISSSGAEQSLTVEHVRGTVVDLFKNSESSSFFELDQLNMRERQGNWEIGTRKPIIFVVSGPLLRCVSGLTSRSQLPLYPLHVANNSGYLLKVDGRMCEPDSLVGIVGGTLEALELHCAGRVWVNVRPIDVTAVGWSRDVVLVEPVGGDRARIYVNRKENTNLLEIGCGCEVVNSTGLDIHLSHSRLVSSGGSGMMWNEIISLHSGVRRVVLVSDKGKEEEDDDKLVAESVETKIGICRMLITSQSKLRFRCTPSGPWSKEVVSFSSEPTKSWLVQCGPEVFAWCNVSAGQQGNVLVRVSAVGVLENHLPVHLYWACLNGTSGMVESKTNVNLFCLPADLVFGFSLLNVEEAKQRVGEADCSKPRCIVSFPEQLLDLDVLSFTVSITQCRHIQISAPIVFTNDLSRSVAFGDVQVAARKSVPSSKWPDFIGKSHDVLQYWLQEEEQENFLSPIKWEERFGVVEALVSISRDTITRSTRIVLKPAFSVQNKSSQTIALRCLDGDLSLPPGDSWSLDVRPYDEENVYFELESTSGGPKRVDVAYGRKYFCKCNDAGVIVSVGFCEGSGFPRTIEAVVKDVVDAPFVVKNECPWPIVVEEKWDAAAGASVVVKEMTNVNMYPLFWKEFLELSSRQESLEDAMARIKEGKEKATTSGGTEEEELFPLELRSKAFVFRLKLADGGNWSELIECSRPHFFDLPLYAEKGARVVQVRVDFAGKSKHVIVGGAPIPAPSFVGWRLDFSTICIRLENLLELVASDVLVFRRGPVVDVSINNYQLENLVDGAVYKMLVSHVRGKKKALEVRLRLSTTMPKQVGKLSVSFANACVELDSASLAVLGPGLANLFKNISSHSSPSEATVKKEAKDTSVGWTVNEVDLAPFDLLMSWENPKSLVPLNLWDDMLSIRHLKLRMPPLVHNGCSLVGNDMRKVFLAYIKEAFVGQTARILGSLDLFGNPTGIIMSFSSSLNFLQQATVAALEGNGSAMLDGASAAVRNFASALLTPLVGLSTASARLVGSGRDGVVGAIKATLDVNRRTLVFVHDYLRDEEPVLLESPKKKK